MMTRAINVYIVCKEVTVKDKTNACEFCNNFWHSLEIASSLSIMRIMQRISQ